MGGADAERYLKTEFLERIAHELEYPSSTALRNAIRRYVGVTATEVRDRGGLQFVLDYFARQIEEWQLGPQGRGHRPRVRTDSDGAREMTAGDSAARA